MSKENKVNQNLLNSVKNENYINILKNENSALDSKLKKVNDLVSKLKLQLNENEQQKNILETNFNQQDKNLAIIRKQLEDTKLQVTALKNKSNNNISILKNENLNLQKDKELNINTITELQKKITDLEFQLKAKNSPVKDQKKFSSLMGGHNFSLILSGNINEKKVESNLEFSKNFGENILNNQNNNNNNNNDLFLTGRNELLEMKENNIKLQSQIELLQKELVNNEYDKNNLMNELEQYTKDKNNLLSILNEKNVEINSKLAKENELNSNLMKQLIENKKILNSLDNIKIKCNNLEKNKKELEDLVIRQEQKVNELSLSVKKIINVVKIKNIEINNSKIYINNLEDTIRDLNKEFRHLRQMKNNDNEKEISYLKTQLENLKKEYQKLIDNNNYRNNSINNFSPTNINANDKMFNYSHITKNQIISKNYNINNYNNINDNNNNNVSNNKNEVITNKNKYRINMNLKSDKNKFFYNNKNSNENKSKRLNYSAFNISNLANKGTNNKNLYINKNKRNLFQSLQQRVNSQKDFSNKLNYIKKGRVKLKHLNLVKNYTTPKVSKRKYNNNNLIHNISMGSIKENKIFKNSSTIRKVKIKKLKKINSDIFNINKLQDDFSNNSVVDRLESKNIYKNPKIIFSRQLSFSKDDKIEKQKIEEFKNLLNRIIYDIDK